MSIDRDRFERASEEELTTLSTADRVLGFLAANADRAFEAGEIARRTDCERGPVSTALSQLKDRGLVVHKATYWAVTDDDRRLADYEGYERATKAFNEQFGSEDASAWRANAASDGSTGGDKQSNE